MEPPEFTILIRFVVYHVRVVCSVYQYTLDLSSNVFICVMLFAFLVCSAIRLLSTQLYSPNDYSSLITMNFLYHMLRPPHKQLILLPSLPIPPTHTQNTHSVRHGTLSKHPIITCTPTPTIHTNIHTRIFNTTSSPPAISVHPPKGFIKRRRTNRQPKHGATKYYRHYIPSIRRYSLQFVHTNTSTYTNLTHVCRACVYRLCECHLF